MLHLGYYAQVFGACGKLMGSLLFLGHSLQVHSPTTIGANVACDVAIISSSPMRPFWTFTSPVQLLPFWPFPSSIWPFPWEHKQVAGRKNVERNI